MKEKKLFNKIGQGVGITCMKEAFIPREYKMGMMSP
jgi:hypothetical protein